MLIELIYSFKQLSIPWCVDVAKSTRTPPKILGIPWCLDVAKSTITAFSKDTYVLSTIAAGFGIAYRYTLMEMLIVVFDITCVWYWESAYGYWKTRKTYQAFIYRFNSYHEYNFCKRKWRQYFRNKFYKYTLMYIRTYLVKLMKIFFIGLSFKAIHIWYLMCWFLWILLTIHLYFHEKTRDLGPSYDIYDYNPEDDMGIYLTIGPFLLLSWFCWTISADTVFVKLMQFFLYKLFLYVNSKISWYTLTIYSFIENAAF